jgi:hypothetical protein
MVERFAFRALGQMRNTFSICRAAAVTRGNGLFSTPFWGALRRLPLKASLPSFVSPHPLIVEFSARCPGPKLRGAKRAGAIVTKHRFS